MESRYLYLALSYIVLFSILAVGGRAMPLLGRWQPIQNLSEPRVQGIGQFAVSEYNQRSKALLIFESLVEGESQVVKGIHYRLVVAAKDREATNNYEAIVLEREWEHFRNLTSFKELLQQ
ncbi:hypothetical protein Q3G72_008444 [Acer saccharum]|nr:hypothetical protein Q3G72_008444 [Acer saccharum]